MFKSRNEVDAMPIASFSGSKSHIVRDAMWHRWKWQARASEYTCHSCLCKTLCKEAEIKSSDIPHKHAVWDEEDCCDGRRISTYT